jgi:uncharacterized membrane protein
MRPLAPLAALIALGALVVVALAGVWSDGDATGHARDHALVAAVAAAIAAVIGGRWRAELPSFSALARLALVASIAFLAAAELIEAIGALGYDPRKDWANEIHGLGDWLTAPAVVAVLAGAVVALAYAATRVRTWRRHPAAR